MSVGKTENKGEYYVEWAISPNKKKIIKEIALSLLVDGERLESCVWGDVVLEKKCNFIKTTYDISLDSQISLLPLGFSLQSRDESKGRKEIGICLTT